MFVLGTANPAPTDAARPTAPGSLAASESGENQIDLTFTASSDNTAVIGYDLYRDGTYLVTLHPLTTAFSDVGLSGSTLYSYELYALDASGNQSIVASASATTDGQANQQPSWSLGDQSFQNGSAVNINLDSFCVDPEAAAIDYSLASGQLPDGLSLSGSRNETLSGTLTTVQTRMFTLSATDNVTAAVEVSINFSVTEASLQAYDYSKWGIPYHTDPVPSAEMPTLPTGADFTNHEWRGFDVLALATPTPTPGGAADEWVIAYNGNDGTAGQNGQGTSANPRRNLPTGAFPAGTKLFLVGDGTALPTNKDTNRKSDFTNWAGNQFNVGTFSGTAASPCWLVGINLPRIRTNQAVFNACSHLIMDGVVFEADGATSGRGSVRWDNSDYCCMRNMYMYGRYSSNGHNQINPAGGDFFCVHNVEIAYCGLFDSTDGGTPDWHGVRPYTQMKHVWVTDCEIHHMAGDSIQTGVSGGWSDPSQAPHYLYYAGGDYHDNRENCIDNKNSFHCIMAKNDCYSNLEQSSAINGTLITMAQDNEGSSSGYHWAIGNLLHDGVVGIRYTGNRGGQTEKGWMINNLVRDCGLIGLWQAGNGTTADPQRYRELTVLHNTVARTPQLFNTEIDYVGAPVDVLGNIGYEVDTAYDVDNDTDFTYSHNTTYNSTGGVSTSGVADTSTNNDLDVDPLLTNPAGNVFTLQAGSPAIGQLPEHPAFQLFEDLYGIDIRYDYDGNARPSSGNWDAGAFQRVA